MISSNASMSRAGSSAAPSRQVPPADTRRSGGQMFSMRDPNRKSAPLPSATRPEKKPSSK